MKKYLLTNICFYFGCLTLFSGFSPPISDHAANQIAGLIIIFCSKAYKSAKMRKNGDAENSNMRLILEITAIIISALLIILQNNLKYLIITDPVPNLIIPLFSITPYILINLKRNKPQEDQITEAS